MKKIILAATAMLLSTGAFAQSFEYGAKTGLNLATMTKMDNAKFRPGIYAGAFVEYVIDSRIGVQVELLYSMQGEKQKMTVQLDMADAGAYPNSPTTQDYVNMTAALELAYINLPILAKIYVFKGLSVDLGPQFGYMVSAKQAYKRDGKTNKYNYYNDSGLKRFDVSAAMGASYKLPFGLDVSARYNLGLTKVSETSNTKNSVIQIGVGYRF